MKAITQEMSNKLRFIFEHLPVNYISYANKFLSTHPWFDEVNGMGYFEKM